MDIDGYNVRCLHIVAGLGVDSGGPTYSVPRIGLALRELGCAVDLMAVGSENEELPDFPGLEIFPPLTPSFPMVSQLRYSPKLNKAMRERVEIVDVIHNHGLWLLPNVYAGRAARLGSKPLVVTPRGMLTPQALEYAKVKKRVFWRLLQKQAFAKAAVWHATSEQEAEDLRSFGIHKPIAIIPNGVDLPVSTYTANRSCKRRSLLFLSRIHPKKGLPLLLEAWKELQGTFKDWELNIVGPSELNHLEYLRRMENELGLKRIFWQGAVRGRQKERIYCSSDLFVLPTHTENFGIVVAEALAAGLPVVTTKGAPWSGLETHRCGWWVDTSTDAIQKALSVAMSKPRRELQAMGLRGREWVHEEFSWDGIARKTVHMYDWVSKRGEKPDFIYQ